MAADLKNLLAHSHVYRQFQNFLGATRLRQTLVSEYLHYQAGQKIVDVGCGPADIFELLPGADYVGIDLSPEYIETAKKRFGEKGRFLCADASQLSVLPGNAFDAALAVGLLHHLSDKQALSLFQSIHASLKPGARFITVDACYTGKQSTFEKFLLSKDRGEYVRTDKQYYELASKIFTDIRCAVRRDQLRIPYTHLFMELKK